MDCKTHLKLIAQYCAPNYDPLPVVLSRGEGVWLYDIAGKKYLDMMSAYSAVSHGHSHPELVETLHQQAQKLAIPSRAFHHDQLAPFLSQLCTLLNFEKALLMNTGAEAVETAIKAARRWGYQVKGVEPNQAHILVASDNFHGRTTTITGFSTVPEYQQDFGPFTPGFSAFEFGNVADLEAKITPNTVAVLVEPMQGEAGIRIPPAGWLKDIRAITRKNNVLLILDEIQTGLGRTGKLLACHHEQVVPDGLILGKALGGGLLPISAFLSRSEVLDLMRPGSHGSTFGANPLACAVASKALDILIRDKLPERSEKMGAALQEALQSAALPGVSEIRGKGLWIGLEVDPVQINAKNLCHQLAQAGLLAKEVHETTIRLAPPLIIEKNTLDWAVTVLQETFNTKR